MKFTKIATLTILLFTVFFSCDQIDELTDFEVSFTLNEQVSIAVEQGDEDVQSFSQSTSLNLGENSDVSDNLNAIENVEITGLTYSYVNVSGNENAQIASAQLIVGNTTIQIEPTNPTNVQGQLFSVQDAAALNAIGNALRNNPLATVVYQGQVEGAPIMFTVDVEVAVTVTIDPI